MATCGDRSAHRAVLTVVPAVCAFVAAGQARAHGFGARYDLPIPLSLYLAGAGVTVAVSFAMLAAFMRSAHVPDERRRLDLSRTACGRALAAPAVLLAVRALGVALFLLVIAAGFFGTQSPLRNIAPVMVWAIGWVGLAYVSALVGDVWALVNPFATLFAWGEALAARVGRGRGLALGLRYPEALGAWPAVVLFEVFVWMELVWEGSDSPARLAAAMCAYAAFTWLGMLLLGRTEWLRRGEVFALVFGLLARFAPIEAREGRGLALRPWGVGLLSSGPAPISIVVLVLAVLAAVCLDGFMETPAWASLVERFASPEQSPANDGDAARAWIRTAAVIGAPLLFAAVYAAFCRMVARAGGARMPVARVMGLYVLTLVPIAIAYHLAHYLSFLVMAWQYLIPLASDPFGFGWDLFGTRNHFVRIGVIDARAVWYVSVGAIVVGHVIAVWLAHCVALKTHADARAARRSQWPMVALMVGYTMTSLWIIAQPIVATR